MSARKTSTQQVIATYETQVAQWLFREISSFSSLPPNYLRLDTATRHFSSDSYQVELTETSRILCENNWDSLQAGSTSFDQLQMDWLAHIYDSPGDIPGPFVPSDPDMNIVPMPSKKWLKNRNISKNVKMFDKKITGESLISEGGFEPNAYVLFEITTDYKLLWKKMAQLERDLTFLWCRHKSSGVNSILEIVRLVGVAAPGIRPDEFMNELKLHTTQLPLLTELWLQQRLVCAVVTVGNAITAQLLSEFNVLSFSMKSEIKQQLENEKILLERLKLEVLEEKIAYWKSRGNQEQVAYLEAELEKYYD